jgi:hypothetical protein
VGVGWIGVPSRTARAVATAEPRATRKNREPVLIRRTPRSVNWWMSRCASTFQRRRDSGDHAGDLAVLNQAGDKHPVGAGAGVGIAPGAVDGGVDVPGEPMGVDSGVEEDRWSTVLEHSQDRGWVNGLVTWNVAFRMAEWSSDMFPGEPDREVDERAVLR